MPQPLDKLEGSELALRVGVIERAKDAFDGDLDAAGCLRAPDLAVTAAAEPLDEFVSPTHLERFALARGRRRRHVQWTLAPLAGSIHARIRVDDGRRLFLDESLYLVELQGEACLVVGELRLVAVHLADAILLINEVGRQVAHGTDVGVPRGIVIEAN